jgi:hypothetical protein
VIRSLQRTTLAELVEFSGPTPTSSPGTPLEIHG